MADPKRDETKAGGRPELGAAAVAALSDLVGETPALRARRLDAAARYADAAWPDRVTHLWRFTDPANLLPTSVAAAPAPEAPAAPADDGAAAAVLMLGGLAPVITVAPEAAAAGLVVKPLAEAADEIADLDAGADAEDGLFQSLNAAAWNVGLFVGVPPRTTLPGPVHLVVDAGAAATLPRVIVAAAEGSEAVVVEEHVGGAPGARIVGMSEVLAGAGARLRHVLVQTWNEGVRGHLTARARVERDADLLTVFATFGGERSKTELSADLAGEGARSEMIGVAMGGGRQRFDHHTRHRHLAGRTWSNIDFKAVADDSARSSYTGLIRIEESARAGEAYQENRNLLLADASRADSIPELEILNEDVSCSHGATVAPVDRDQLFYLESRGLDPDVAVRLVVRGFLERTMSRLPDALRDRLEEQVAARLARLHGRAS